MKNILIISAALLVAGCNLALAAEPITRPNILFIITDQQFADAMSCRMGQEFLHTPSLDRLAQNGRLFTRAYSANPICMPSRNAMFTGRYPHETGVIANNPPPGGKLNPEKFMSLGTYFQRAGYQTAYFGKWHLCFDEKNPSAHGFETLNTAKGDTMVSALAVKFISEKPARPFLLVASFLNPHNVCEWARRLSGRNDKLSQGDIGEPPPLEKLPPLPANLAPQKNEPDGITYMRKAYQVDTGPFPVSKFTAEDWRKERWGYYRMIEMVDAQIGKVLAALHDTGFADNTLVVFTSDHGECAGAQGFNQKTVFFEESARVPLIVSFPGKIKPGSSAQLANTGIDLLPTMLDFAGLEIPKKLPGRSLRPLATGQPVTDWRDHVVVENDLAQAGVLNGFTPRMQGRMVRTERYKYCLYGNGNQRESLVDLQADPGETINLATDPAHRETLRQHRALLAQFGEQHHDPLIAELLADNVKPIPFAPAATRSKSKSKKSQP